MSLLLGAMLVSCNRGVDPELEADVIKTIYHSLNNSPEQFATNMANVGLTEQRQYDFMVDHYKTFANDSERSPHTIIVNIHFNSDTILRVDYEREIKYEKNIAAYYRLFSDKIASFTYIKWSGFYRDAFDYSADAQEATDRNDLCNHINNEHLSDVNTMQEFIEKFVHVVWDKNCWNGQILLGCDRYWSGVTEATGKYYKDIYLNFSLEREQE